MVVNNNTKIKYKNNNNKMVTVNSRNVLNIKSNYGK